MLQLNKLSLKRANKALIEEANLTIFVKNKVGIVGANGTGKSSLFALLLGQLEPFAGNLSYPKQLRIAHLAQDTPALDCSALDYVLDGDSLLRDIERQLANTKNDNETIITLHEAYENADGYTARARAASLLSGLGFDAAQLDIPVRSFSGGWRMRLNLAQSLMCPSDLLLLDEPTNHLDMEAIIWLEKFLGNYSGTLLLISHDRDFLDNSCDHILHFEQKNLHLYSGNYSQFERLRAEKLALQQSMHEKQRRHIAHMQSFVARFKAKASKAKQAQSRVKALEKMELIGAAHVDSPFTFRFASSTIHSNPLMNLSNVALGYHDTPIIKGVNLSLLKDSRIGLLGPNGAGKSTLIKCLAGQLAPLSGEFTRSQSKLTVGYYTQHQLESLNVAHSAVEHVMQLSPKADEQRIRTYLGSFNFHGDMAIKPIAPFSGGEKARLALALTAWRKPNVLLLDEPTNHLDLDMRSAIEMALQEFEGAVVLITHDRHLLETSVDELFLVADGQVEPFHGELLDYHRWLQNHGKTNDSPVQKKEKTGNKFSNKSSNRIKKIETLLSSLEKKLNAINDTLADNAIYDDQQRLHQLLEQQSSLKAQALELEEEWLTLSI